MIKVVVFDLGNVILPFDLYPVINTLSTRSSLKDTMLSKEVFKTYFWTGKGSYLAYETGTISTEEFFNNLKREFALEIGFEEFRDVWISIFREDKEVSGIVRELKAKGVRLFVLSNTNEMHYDYIDCAFPVVRLFDEHILSHQVKTRKPERAIYDEIFKRTDALPGEVLFIDDMEKNVAAAAEMGIRTHHFKGAADLRKFLSAEGLPVC